MDGPVGLGHRRLAIIDTASRADQPMADHDDRLVIVFNGEIYNFAEIKKVLEEENHRFRTLSDTEVILEAYKHWGINCLHYFNGMFAFALWDKKERCLFLARDRAGEKPLYYAEGDGTLMFASEPRALRSLPGLDKTVDPAMLGRYLTLGYLTGGSTLYKGMNKLPPGCFMLVRPGAPPRIERYWSLRPAFDSPCLYRSERDAAAALTELIDDSTRLRMVSDVPLGAFLSGGIDSATVVASMSRQGADVHTFSVGFQEDAFNETSLARDTARALGSIHQDLDASIQPEEMIKAIRHAADDPLADNSAIPTWFLCAFARQHVTVALSGDGGDEMFAGYETYLADDLVRSLTILPRYLWQGAEWLAERILPARFDKVGWDEKVRRFTRGARKGWPRAHYSWRHLFDDDERDRLIRPGWRDACRAVDPYGDFEARYTEVIGLSPLNQALYVDTGTWMVDDVLAKVDRMAMAHSLEVRTPFLDHRIMEFAANLPPNWKLKGRRKKHLLKESQNGRLPAAVINRKKMGFNAPMSHWLAGPLREFTAEWLKAPALAEWVIPAKVELLWNDHLKKRRDNGFKLYCLLCLSLWLGEDRP